MVELSLKIGDSESETLETAVLISSLSNLIMWVFFIVLTKNVVDYIKKKNAQATKRKHSSRHHNE